MQKIKSSFRETGDCFFVSKQAGEGRLRGISKKERVRFKGMLCAVVILLLLGGAVRSVWTGTTEEGLNDEDLQNESVVPKKENEKQEEGNGIRVLIRNSDYAGIYHERLELFSESGFRLSFGDPVKPSFEEHVGGETLCIDQDSFYFEAWDRLWIRPGDPEGIICVKNVRRNLGTPAYGGSLEVIRVQEGLLLINETDLEEYLCGVVPSEMPAGYPMEALKAQAICARTYAYGKTLCPGYPQYGADLDDSTAFQVYQNVERAETASQAVRETEGYVLRTGDGRLAETYYYSTSCGQGTDIFAWGGRGTENLTGEYAYLNAKRISKGSMERFLAGEEREMPLDETVFLTEGSDEDYEWDQPWYRWSYEVSEVDAPGLAVRIGNYLGEDVSFERLLEIRITKRGAGAVAEELLVKTDRGEYLICGERSIREVLCDGETKVKQRDGNEVTCARLLPSAFFCLDAGIMDGNVVQYKISGGGSGHGVGMSQNAAGKMALEGRRAEEILGFFYEDCILCKLP